MQMIFSTFMFAFTNAIAKINYAQISYIFYYIKNINLKQKKKGLHFI